MVTGKFKLLYKFQDSFRIRIMSKTSVHSSTNPPGGVIVPQGCYNANLTFVQSLPRV